MTQSQLFVSSLWRDFPQPLSLSVSTVSGSSRFRELRHVILEVGWKVGWEMGRRALEAAAEEVGWLTAPPLEFLETPWLQSDGFGL